MKLESIEDRKLADVTGGDMFDSPLAILAIPLMIGAYHQETYTPPVPATPVLPAARPAAPRGPQHASQKQQPSWP